MVSVPLQDQNQQMTLDWEKFMEGVHPSDKEEIKRRMKPIYDETDAWKKDPTQSIPYTSSRVKAAIKQFTELVSDFVVFVVYYLHDSLHRLKHIALLKALKSAVLLHTSVLMHAPRSFPHSGEAPTSFSKPS